MTHDVLEPIPVEYNSNIIHLIEGYAKAQKTIQEVEAAKQELKQSLERNLEQCQLVVDDCLQRESQYQAEVKRLEFLLFRNRRRGPEAVALAKTDSFVDSSNFESGGLLSRFNGEFGKASIDGPTWSPSVWIAEQRANIQAKESHQDDADGRGRHPERFPTPKILDDDNDFLMSEKFRGLDVTAGASNVPSRAARRNPHTNVFITTPPRERQAYRRGEMLESEPVGIEVRELCSQYPFVTLGGRHQPNPAAHPSTETASFHKQDQLSLSFKVGDNCDSFLDHRFEGQEGFNLGDYGQTSRPERSRSGSAAPEMRQHYTSSFNGLASGSTPGDERGRSREINNLTIRHLSDDASVIAQSPASRRGQKSQASDQESYRKFNSSPSSYSHSRNSSIAGQETPRRTKKRDNDARIAATIALANALGGTNQNK
ncbi:hypothetical protein NUW58_g6657 [Xylaria curta]|uniref:Uncharacterized protein n=1 Tax=Xylaria curta TaxID=42375 RepID=A0ACC1NRM7_9PEZI|nr:hypothetical protein NUW58_g6657 [Xylaria curta]